VTLVTGTAVGSYEVVAPLGAGGMGEVYCAKDTRLDREVAIKVLPEAFSRDPERMVRFRREAKVLASLNHPNIAAIYGFEEVDGKALLIMELAEGETLAESLKRGAMPVEEALGIAKQVTEALEAAHDKGIIHRDLKPANVKVSPEGRVKVLDFGLAKALAGGDESSRTEITTSPTITADFTRPGVILGTAAYMSPEQARAKPLDKRTDIWSFGCILYEFLTGHRIFGGETTSDAIGAILHKEPDWTALPPTTPPTVQLLLRRCLAKDRNQRLRDIGDARIELANAISDPTSSSLWLADSALSEEDHRHDNRRGSPLQLIGMVLLAVAAAAAAWLIKPQPASVGQIRAEIPAPRDGRIIYAGDVAGPAVVSPDGTMVAYVAQQQGNRQQIWLRRLSESESRPLRGTERAEFPFWSPDSKALGFVATGKLKRVDLLTKTAMTICDVSGGRGGTWMTKDVIVLAPGFQDGLYQVPATGGTPVRVTEVDTTLHTSHRWPASVGDGNHFLYTAINHDPDKSQNGAIYLGSLDGVPPRRIVPSLLNAEYALGHMLFVRDTVLVAAPLDLTTGTMTGDSAPIANDVTPDLSTWRAAFSASEAGILAYHSVVTAKDGKDASNGTPLGVGSEANVSVKYDRTGTPRSRIADGTSQLGLRIGPDNQLALSVVNDREFGIDLWVYDMGVVGQPPDPSAARRVTSMPFVECSPVWSPDGSELAFSHMFVGNGSDAIYRKRIGGGVEHKLVESASGNVQIWPMDWTSDGKYLVYATGTWVTRLGTDIHVLPLEGGEPIPLLTTDRDECNARVSPNGKWMAFRSGTSDHTEVYVVPFAPEGGPIRLDASSGMPAEQWQISVGGGESPCWRGDGKELYYISDDSELVAVTVDTDGDTFQVGPATTLFQTKFEAGAAYDVQQDGERFVFNEVTVNVDTPISLIINWNELLKR